MDVQKLFCCRCLLAIVTVALLVGTSSAAEPKVMPSLGSPSSSSDGNSGSKSDRMPHETISAAKRLIRASLATKDEETHGDDAVELTDDLITILQLSFDSDEIEAMIQDVRNESRDTNTSVSTASTSTKAGGECSASASMAQGGDNPPTRMTGDRHAAALLDTVQDMDCLEREFDVQNENEFDVEEAVDILRRCRILVLRNVFSKETTERVLPHYRRYISDVASEKISSEGTTTFGGDYFILKEDNSRFNYMATKQLVELSTGLLDNQILIEILSDHTILGDSMIVNHVGTIDAQPGADVQYWHADGDYVPSNDVDNSGFLGVGGHDLPPFAINMFTPLLPKEGMGPEHGPTEFCLGTSHLKGHDMEEDLPVDDLSLLKADRGIVEHLQEFEWHVERGLEPPPHVDCPRHLHRIPLLKEGDVLLFDYMLTHRGGANRSRKTNRSMIFATYSKKWFRDTNFDTIFGRGPTTPLEELTRLTRFALVEETGQ